MNGRTAKLIRKCATKFNWQYRHQKKWYGRLNSDGKRICRRNMTESLAQ